MIYTKEQTASLFVDPQKGFTPICPNELPVEGGDEIVPALLEQLNYSHIHTASKDAHNRNAIWVANEKQKQFDPIQGDNVDGRELNWTCTRMVHVSMTLLKNLALD